MNLKNIAGSEVNLDHPDIVGAKAQADLTKLGIFDHLVKEQMEAANKELWDALHKAVKKEDTVKE